MSGNVHAAGFLACFGKRGAKPPLDGAVPADVTPVLSKSGSGTLLAWGEGADRLHDDGVLVLTRGARRREQALDPAAVRGLLCGLGVAGLAEVLPTFAAMATSTDGSVTAATDALGFRHLYYGENEDCVAMSTSARSVAACLGARPDLDGIAIQSLLGWQLGQRTLFGGVHKLAPGEFATLSRDGIRVHGYQTTAPRIGIELDAAVAETATMLRTYLASFLDDHPDAVVQLTGGQDSRLLLSAIEPERRRGLRCMTLGLPDNPDVVIAGDLARRCGMDHEVLTLDGLDRLTPEEADDRCLRAASLLEGMADPLAQAALDFAEAAAQGGPRLSGLGGEVARGFYYLGPVMRAPVTRRRVEWLTRWRMFANESVPQAAMEPEFAARAAAFGVDEVFRLCRTAANDWLTATDEFYLGQRMQRWAGVTETAVCSRRHVNNPMLDDRFIAIARGLDPRDKRNSLFLSRLQTALDRDLARIPLDGRPAPIAYTDRSLAGSARQLASTGEKLARKVRQRVARENRPPAGGTILAGKVVEHWRRSPDVLDQVRGLEVFREAWLDEVLAGRVDPGPSAVALMTNLRAATR